MHDEHGFTLVEIMISVWILGALMVAFIGALFTMTKTSDITRRAAVAEAELRQLETTIRSATYVPCDSASATNKLSEYGLTMSYSASSGDTVTIADNTIKNWDGTPYAGQADTADLTHVGTSCPSGGDKGIQVVDLSVTVAGSPAVTRTQTGFVKQGS